MKRNIDPNIKELYLSWYVTPPGQRDPSTKTEFAEQNGIHVRTLYNWERDEDFRERQIALRKEWGLALHSDILSRLMSIVTGGKDTDSIAAARILLGHLDLGAGDDGKQKVDKSAIATALAELGFEVRDAETS